MPRVGQTGATNWEWYGLNIQNQVGQFWQMPADGWIVQCGVHMGGYNASPNVEICLWDVNSGCYQKLWGSGIFQVGNGRAWREVAVPALRRAAGQGVRVGFWRDQAVAAQWSYANDGGVHELGGPNGTWGGTSLCVNESHSHGSLTSYFDYVPNNAPVMDGWVSAPSGSITDTNPLFQGRINHGADQAYDTTSSVHWQVWRVDNGQYLINQEVTAGINNSTRVWSLRPSDISVTLPVGVTLRSQFRHKDSWGLWSPWSPVTEFQINAGPNLPTLTGPSGKINTLTPTYQGSYSHPNGLAANRIRVWLFSAIGTLLDTKEAAISVASGGNWAISHSTLGLTSLQWGTAYTWSAALRDTAGVWSNGYFMEFRTNAAPDVPSSLTPGGGAVVSGTVVLRAMVSDPDGDTLTALTWDLWNVTDDVQVAGYPATQMGSWANWSTVSRDVTAALTLGKRYLWRLKAHDGTLEGQYAAWRAFLYTNAPSVVLTTPANGATVTNPALTITITYSGSAAKVSDRTLIEREESDGTWTTVYDSGYVSGARTSWTTPVGVLLNNSTYRITVWARDTNGLEGQSTPAVFTTSWTPPPAPVLTVAAGDPTYAVINLAWQQTSLSDSEFVAYEVAKEAMEEGGLVTVAYLRRRDLTSYTYHFPVSGRAYTFRVRVWQQVGVEFVPSDWTSTPGLVVQYDQWWIKAVDDPVGLRVPFRSRVAQPPQATGQADQTAIRAWGAAAPIHLVGEGRMRSGNLQVTGWEGDGLPVSLTDRLRQLRELDQRRGTVCLLMQYPPDKAFAMLGSIRYQPDVAFGEVVDVDWEETAYDEDVTARGEGL